MLDASYLDDDAYGPWLVAVAREPTLPAWLRDGNWTDGWARVVPTEAWLNFEARVTPHWPNGSSPLNASLGDGVANESSVIYLRVTCPLPDQCTTSSSTNLGAGARLYLAGVEPALSAGEFFYDEVGRESCAAWRYWNRSCTFRHTTELCHTSPPPKQS